MLTAYFDDSGTHRNSSVIVVAGFVSSALQWGSFIDEWARLRRRLRVPIVHMADMENLRNEFNQDRGWSVSRREEFLPLAAALIRHRTIIPIGHAVIRRDWEEVFPAELKKVSGGPFGWCAHECVAEVRRWKLRTRRIGPTQFVFEDGTNGQGEVSDMLKIMDQNFYGIAGYSFQKKTLAPLQAADWIAYELYKQMLNQIIAGPLRPVRFTFSQLIGKRSPRHLTYWNKARFSEWLSKAKSLLWQ